MTRIHIKSIATQRVMQSHTHRRNPFLVARLLLMVLATISPLYAATLMTVEGTLSGNVFWETPGTGTPGQPWYSPPSGDSVSFDVPFSGTSARNWNAVATSQTINANAHFGLQHSNQTPGMDEWILASFHWVNVTGAPYLSGAEIKANALMTFEILTPQLLTLSQMGTTPPYRTDYIAAEWLSTSGETWSADFDALKDGVVVGAGILRLNAEITLNQAFIPPSPFVGSAIFEPIAVPEPSSCVLLLSQAIYLLMSRRRHG
jgi:hypothetical protein